MGELTEVVYDKSASCFQLTSINSQEYLMKTTYSLYENNLTLLYLHCYRNSLHVLLISALISCLSKQSLDLIVPNCRRCKHDENLNSLHCLV